MSKFKLSNLKSLLLTAMLLLAAAGAMKAQCPFSVQFVNGQCVVANGAATLQVVGVMPTPFPVFYYPCGNPGATQMFTANTNPFTITGLTNGGCYCFEVRDPTGCSSTVCTCCPTPLAITVTASGNPCPVAGACVTLTANGLPPGVVGSYQWCDGSTNQSITLCPATTCCVTVTDMNGCTGSACFTPNCCDDGDDYTNAGPPWTQIGTTCAITGGVVNYNNCRDDACANGEHRLVKPLVNPLPATWTAEWEFSPISAYLPGHSIVDFTAGAQNPYSAFSCSPANYPPSNQDAILVDWNCPNAGNNGFGTWRMEARSKLGTVLGASSSIPFNYTGGTYYFRLERLSATQGQLSIYSNPARTVHIPGSPVCFSIQAGLQPLTHVQHGQIAWGGFQRIISATLDNLCIRYTQPPCAMSQLDWCYDVEPFGNAHKITIHSVTSNCPGTATYMYSFNGGSTWTTNPVKTNLAPGAYSVCVRAVCTTNPCNVACTRICCKDIVISPLCNIPITAGITTVNVNNQTGNVSFAASTLSPAAAGYDWDFNNDGIWDLTTTGNTTSQVLAPGNYTICVRIRRSADCFKVSCANYTVNAPCNPRMLMRSTVCTNAPLTVTFTSLAQNATSVNWDFGDGSPVQTGNVVTHTYANYGSYNVCATAYGAANTCYQTTCATILLGPVNCVNLRPANAMGDDGHDHDVIEVPTVYIAEEYNETSPIEMGTPKNMALQPNPTDGFVTVSFDATVSGTLEIIDINGKSISSQKVTEQNQVSLNLMGRSIGLYLIRFVHENGNVMTERLVLGGY